MAVTLSAGIRWVLRCQLGKREAREWLPIRHEDNDDDVDDDAYVDCHDYFVAITSNKFVWQNVFSSIFLAPSHNPTCLGTKCYTAGGCDWHIIDIKSGLSFGLVLMLQIRGQRHYNLWSNFFCGVFPQAPIIPVKYYVAGAENNAIFWRKSSFSPSPSSIKSSQRSEQNCPFVVQKWDKALKTCCVAKCFQKKRGNCFQQIVQIVVEDLFRNWSGEHKV